MMGYRTPNIDRIAKEGALFTDWYGQQSCTAGRAAFITGQSPIRTGLTKVGLPGRARGPAARRTRPSPSCSSRSATPPASSARTTSATATSTCRRCTASTSSSATSTTSTPRRSRRTPTTRRTRRSRRKFGPRGVLHCYATATEEAAADPRFGAWGKQKFEDTGPLTRKRMETVDDEFLTAARRLHRQGAPRPTSRSSSGGTPPGCTSGRTSSPASQGKTGHRRLPRRHGRARRHGRRAAGQARRARHRRTTPSSCTRPTTVRRR